MAQGSYTVELVVSMGMVQGLYRICKLYNLHLAQECYMVLYHSHARSHTSSVVHRACTFLLARNCVYSCLFSMGMVQDLHTIELVFTWEWYRICRVPFPYYLHLIWEWYRICTQQNLAWECYRIHTVQFSCKIH